MYSKKKKKICLKRKYVNRYENGFQRSIYVSMNSIKLWNTRLASNVFIFVYVSKVFEFVRYDFFFFLDPALPTLRSVYRTETKENIKVINNHDLKVIYIGRDFRKTRLHVIYGSILN